TDQLRYGNACIGISRAFLAQQKPETAIQFAKKALNISQKSDLQQMQYDANNQLAAIYQRVGNYKEAFAYKLEANHYLEKSGIESVENTETVYRTTINLLQSESQKNKMKEEKRFYLFMIIAGIVFTFSAY
ncbi:hypothetical protein JZU68_09890, partial [bacterium]|nr:hypothetical protein [bacterium]